MYLLNVQTYQLEDINVLSPSNEVKYAILSHRWDHPNEVLYQDIISSDGKINPKAKEKSGFAKLEGACKEAEKDNLKYIWIDTCCIDKSSSAELSEAINSMYRYYQEAAICYAYLAGLPSDTDPQTSTLFANHEWYQRGWTLQELIAPFEVIFYTNAPDTTKDERSLWQDKWIKLGRKSKLCERLSQITGIDSNIFSYPWEARRVSIAKRMSWAVGRRTTRIEDRAYSLMGLFNVNMPLLYGEGSKAFIRLQEEIMKESSDESIFLWRNSLGQQQDVCGLLAGSPDMFKDSGQFSNFDEPKPRVPFAVTNHGLQISLHLEEVQPQLYVAALSCCRRSKTHAAIGIYLTRKTNFSKYNKTVTYDEYARVYPNMLLTLDYATGWDDISTIFIHKHYLRRWHVPIKQRLVQLGRLPDPEWYRLNSVMGRRLDRAASEETRHIFQATHELNRLVMVLIFKRRNGSVFTILIGTHRESQDLAPYILDYSYRSNNWMFVRQENPVMPQSNGSAIIDLGSESVEVNITHSENIIIDIFIMRNPESHREVIPRGAVVDVSELQKRWRTRGKSF